MANQQIIYRKDYKAPEYLIKHTNLYFNIISLEQLEVTAKLLVTKNNNNNSVLVLNGEDLQTVYIKLNNNLLEESKDYSIKDNLLTIFKPLDSFILETKVVINPSKNTTLMGVYKSQNILCSQCEPEGFRRITWFIDRPDNMGKWDVTIEANKKDFPILLSNGNETDSQELANNRILKSFNDPFNKPCYLFAFVAGDFDYIHDTYTTTISNKKVDLYIYVDKGKKDQAYHAMDSLKKSMLWDEQTYNLEYDLNIFSIVTVRDFNFGAMENKSLNIFNEVYILSDPKTTTDSEFYRTEAVVAHEYFHNWTGDRITCRDWFQLTLKEGLTVFRDHTFSEDHHYADCARIIESEVVRKKQFAEDNSPLSHPIRPEQYIEMNNFYTSTVYEKGSEVIRMIHTIIGEEKFKQGIKVYFDNFDGKAVTCDDFIWSMEQASSVDLTDFKKWYSQSGTPIVEITTNYNQEAEIFTVKLSQSTPSTSNQAVKNSLVIPLKTALFNENGEQLDLHSNNSSSLTAANNKETIIMLDSKTKEQVFTGIKTAPSLSINRFFSAPVMVKYAQTDVDLKTLIKYDNDGFAKFDASRKYFTNVMLDLINKLENNQEISINSAMFTPFIEVLNSNNPYLASMIIKIPDFETIAAVYTTNIPVLNIYKIINKLKFNLAKNLEAELLAKYNSLLEDPLSISKENYAARALKNTLLDYLVKLNKPEYFELAINHYNASENMTNRLGALIALKDYTGELVREDLFNKFYDEYKEEVLVVNKLLSVEALSQDFEILNKVLHMVNNETIFSWYNPNKVYALIGTLTQGNHLVFHEENGHGYNFLANAIIKLDDINTSVASKMAAGFLGLKKYPAQNQKLMRIAMEKIMKKPSLSNGVFEIVSKILEV